MLFIDIREWGSPVAEQYGINSIPHLKVYGPDGALVAEGGRAINWLAQKHPHLFAR